MGRILVTGHGGLVGSQFCGNIVGISSRDCDLRKTLDVDKLFDSYTNKDIDKELAVDKVIHCAGKVGGLGSNMMYKADFFYDNIMINTNVIEACRKYNIKKMVAFLSTCVFPADPKYPLTENQIHDGPPHYSNDAYAYSKRMVDIQIRSYREQYNLEYTSVIPTNIYGPNDNFNIDNGHIIPSIIHKCYMARKNNMDLVVWGSGKPLREFIYSKDVADLALWVLDNYNEEEPIILSTSEEISISDVVSIIAKCMNFTGKIIFDKARPDGQFKKPSDNFKIKKYLPGYRFTSFEDGILETVRWFEDNYPNIRF
jgi:GDP-L-fucose synthase